MKFLALAAVLSVAALVLPASSCAGDKALIVSGETMVSMADQFVATAAAMDAALDSKAITPATYGKWKAFGLKFQAAYPLASNLWQTASDHHDDNLRAQAVAMVLQLSADLTAYGALVGMH